MARFGLTIQKKFLFLILLVGLIPAILGVVMIMLGTRLAFSRVMASALQDRAVALSRQIDRLCEKTQDDLQEIVQKRGGDLDGMGQDSAALGGVDFIVRYRSAEDIQVLPVVPRADDLTQRIYDLAPYFQTLLAKIPKGTMDGYFDDVSVPGPWLTDEPGWILYAYAPDYGGLIFFFVRGDFVIQQVRNYLSAQDDIVQIFSSRGYLLNKNLGPSGFPVWARQQFHEKPPDLAGEVTLRTKDPGGHEILNLVGYAISRRGARLAASNKGGEPCRLLASYDMENFLGPQARLVWFAVGAAAAWALLLMAVSIAAARRIVGPVKVLRRQAEAMARGNLNARAKVRTHDEIEDLAEAFNTMADKLRESYERITTFNQELEQKVIERTRALAKANQKLIQTEKHSAMGRLAANLAHEINNPLGIIKNYLRLAASGMSQVEGGRRKTDPNLDRLNIVNQELDRIAKIVRQLLDLHRPVEQSVKETDINALLDDMLLLMEKGLGKEKIEIRREFAPDLPKLMVAPDLIRQVAINLLRNAQDAMENGGVLTVKTESRMEWNDNAFMPVVVISVSDTGYGISQENLDRIFDPFFTTKSAEKGTGLGLAVSYGIVQMYQGSIEVLSEAGKGTTMAVTLPIEPRGRKPDGNGKPDQKVDSAEFARMSSNF